MPVIPTAPQKRFNVVTVDFPQQDLVSLPVGAELSRPVMNGTNHYDVDVFYTPTSIANQPWSFVAHVAGPDSFDFPDGSVKVGSVDRPDGRYLIVATPVPLERASPCLDRLSRFTISIRLTTAATGTR